MAAGGCAVTAGEDCCCVSAAFSTLAQSTSRPSTQPGAPAASVTLSHRFPRRSRLWPTSCTFAPFWSLPMIFARSTPSAEFLTLVLPPEWFFNLHVWAWPTCAAAHSKTVATTAVVNVFKSSSPPDDDFPSAKSGGQ
jgi:hypothetical protein